ncbi:hypothetical protein PENTCL1PPCAC_87, partial [Pristionchus entomophagus]
VTPIEELNDVKRFFVLSFTRNSTRSDQRQAFLNFTQDLYNLLEKHPKNLLLREDDKELSTILSFRSIFFTTTSLTSIGYGVDAPSSVPGRLFCIAYLFCGIPLYLITLADTVGSC